MSGARVKPDPWWPIEVAPRPPVAELAPRDFARAILDAPDPDLARGYVLEAAPRAWRALIDDHVATMRATRLMRELAHHQAMVDTQGRSPR